MPLQEIVNRIQTGGRLQPDEALRILKGPSPDLPELLQAAFVFRKRAWGLKVLVHIINNVQNGQCSEDCSYCVQAKSAAEGSRTDYPMKSDQEIFAEAERAYRSGAYRYCMVFSGKGPSDSRIDHLCDIIRELKRRYPMELCVSPGLINEPQARRLKSAGLNRLNHNLNSTQEHYPNICTTHDWSDRLQTLRDTKAAGLDLCSGFIVGMGEGPGGVVEMLDSLSELGVSSVPVNFLVPLPGASLGEPETLSPIYCLRVLCLARLMMPDAEIRAAGGREHHLRGLQFCALYAVNSLFVDGYLNVEGSGANETKRMILDAGFEIETTE